MKTALEGIEFKMLQVRNSRMAQSDLIFVGDTKVTLVDGHPFVLFYNMKRKSFGQMFGILPSGDLDDLMGVDLNTDGHMISITLIGSGSYRWTVKVPFYKISNVITVLG